MFNANDAAGTQATFNAMCLALTAMTERNDHLNHHMTSVDWLVENFNVGQALQVKYKHVKALYELEQHLAHGLNDYEYGLYTQLKDLMHQTVGEENYQKWYQTG